jgi:hypothetical protein
MGWQRRGSGRYYYSSEWRDGRPRNVYIGSGPVAELLSDVTENRRSEQRRARQEIRAVQQKLRPLDETLRRLERDTALLMEAQLRSLGFYRSHDNWRGKRRVRKLGTES